MDELDLASAQLRADARDLPAFVETLAARLEAELPGRVEVERRRTGLLGGRRRVSRIRCRVADEELTLTQDRDGIAAQRAKVVRGITLKTESLDVAAWTAALAAAVEQEAGASAGAYAALRELLA